MKLGKTIVFACLSILCGWGIYLFDVKDWPAGSNILGIILGSIFPMFRRSIQDLMDKSNWEISQRRLERGGFIKGDTIIRVSFAYLYRIKISDKYLLVKNERGTGKYQPVGGVYKMKGNEKVELKNLFLVKDDNKVPIDASSRDDYRLRMENKYLRKFIERFNKNAEREQIEDLSREFKEELIKTGIVNWDHITYRFCGRHMTEIEYGEHFQIYELLLADVVELIPSLEQEADLRKLMEKKSDIYRFATAEEIDSLGVNTSTGNLVESISDHTKKIIQEKEDELLKIPGVGKEYTVQLNNG